MKTPTKIANLAALLLAVVLASGCVSMPTGPGVMVLPGTGKNFDQFRVDDMECRQFASNQVGGTTAEQAQADSAVKSAAVGAAVGAVAGAVIGGRGSAAAGAGTGLIIGGVAGAGTGNSSGRGLQQRYDIGYQQCMYAKGHKIPTTGRYENSATRPVASTYTSTPPPPPTAGAIPPPPPGSPPPPPPGVK